MTEEFNCARPIICKRDYPAAFAHKAWCKDCRLVLPDGRLESFEQNRERLRAQLASGVEPPLPRVGY